MSRLVGPPVRALMDAVTAEVVRELPASAVVLKIFEAATEKSLADVITGALERLVRRLEMANLDITLGPGAVVRPEVVDRDSDPGASPDTRPL